MNHYYSLLFGIVVLAQANGTKTAFSNKVGNDNWDQVVAKFPIGAWDGSCDIQTLRFLPESCSKALTPDSTPGEKLACNIITSPDTLGLFPFGMYPTDTLLTTEVKEVSSMGTTKVFSDCGMAQMINDGCFTFRSLTSSAEHRSEQFATANEYATQLATSFGLEVSASVGYGPITARASYSQQTSEATSKSAVSKVAGASQAWSNNVGALSMGTCALRGDMKKYLSEDYLSKWESIADLDSFDLMQNSVFRELMNDGFHIPVSFDYGVQYAASVTTIYDQTSSSSTSSMSNALSAGLDVSYFGASGSLSAAMSKAISNTASSSQVTSKSTGLDSAYGSCEFDKLMINDGKNWTGIMAACAKRVANNLELLQQPGRVSNGGFINILDMLTNSNFRLPSELEDAMNQYFAYCECLTPNKPMYADYQCYYGNGRPITNEPQTCITSNTCSKSFWFRRDGAGVACYNKK